MTFDTITIIIGCVLLLLAVAAVLSDTLLRLPDLSDGAEAEEADSDRLPGFSIVMSVHDKMNETERNLPHFLEQAYDGSYEVIVVDESSTDDTEDILTRLKAQYKHLYTTFIPESSHYLSRRKLALTVGVKAARYEWVIFTDADCHPASDQWLKALSRHILSSPDKDIMMGYTPYDEEASSYERFDRMTTWIRQARQTRGTAYAYCGHALAFRKKLFMDHDGFLGNLKYLRGEYDFTVNEYALPGNTIALSEPDCRLVQDAPWRKTWINEHLYQIETTRHLDRRTGYHLPHLISNLLLHVSLLASLAAAAVATILGQWIVLAAACLSLLLMLVMRMVVGHRATKAMGESLPAWKLPMMELSELWRYAALRIRHAKSDPYDFIRR